ncbi:MAG: 2-iminoacetate synthase ThiH [Planctomycetes bacterium]|nr:2-iminoacetate synthase ThiH [Planctomycetota bacterium]
MQTHVSLQDFSDLCTRHAAVSDRGLWQSRLDAVTGDDVRRALEDAPGVYRPDRLCTLIAPAAQDYLEDMAYQAHRLTVQRFGQTVSLYAPLYVSSYCCNQCLYCGFNCSNDYERCRLSLEEAEREARIIHEEGFTDLLLVSSEDREFITVDYLCELAQRLRGMFSSLSLEIHQLETSDYKRLFDAGIDGVTLYQETYDPDVYARYHLKGPKADFKRRLRAFDSFGRAGMRKMGLGALLGLTDWRLETLALGMHGRYLMKQYWQSQISFSFPRLRPANEVQAQQFDHCVSDEDLVQMLLALRLCFADAGLVISTRESERLRDALVRLGVTKMSAGSKTNPGGYGKKDDTLEQFVIDDARTPAQIADMLKSQGKEAVWKDWDCGFHGAT